MDKIEVFIDKWNNRITYLGHMNYSQVSKIIKLEEDLSMNRRVNPDRRDKIVDYMKNNANRIFFPPVILTSCEKINLKKKGEVNIIELNQKSLTVIDGQHRISAIKKIENDKLQKKIFENKKVAFLIIENLDQNEHRNLFNLINENAVKVESTVSARFKITKENVYGLRFIKEKMHDENSFDPREMIEWENKQSPDKICYLFITKVNKGIIAIMRKFTTEDRDADEYGVIKHFWEKYFEFINTLDEENENRSLYVRKITMYMIVEAIKGEYENEKKAKEKLDSYEKLKKRIDDYLGFLLIDASESLYDGIKRESKEVYMTIYNNIKNYKKEE